MTIRTPSRATVQPSPRLLVPVLVFIGLVVAAIGSLGAPLVPSVATHAGVSLGAAQWTLTVTLLTGALSTPVLARLGEGPHRRRVILSTLAIVVAGCVVTVLPLGFYGLLAGRGLQGIGVGLTSLIIGVARDELPERRARSAIGLLSVTSVAGIGLGYPLAGLLTRYGGLEAAYAGGLVVTAAALLASLIFLPRGQGRSPVRTDFLGVGLLGVAVTGSLLAFTEASTGLTPPWLTVGVILGCVVVGAFWVRHELRAATPLVDLRQLRLPMVALADVSVFLGGIGTYLLMSLASRYVQTPASAGYGVPGSVITAGLVLVPFSLCSFVANRITPALRRKLSGPSLVSISCLIDVAAAVACAVMRGDIWEMVAVMGLTGFGVGLLLAAVPALIVASVPASQTTSAVGFNQLARTVGVTIGSALCGIVLQSATPANASVPADGGYTVAALIGAAVLLVPVAIGCATLRLTRHRTGTRSTDGRSDAMMVRR